MQLQLNLDANQTKLLCHTSRVTGGSKGYEHFHPYLYKTKFKYCTNHASLRLLCRRHEPLAQVARWLEIMSTFSYDMKHQAGKHYANADKLHRQTTCLDCKQCSAIEQKYVRPSLAGSEIELWSANRVVKVQAQNSVACNQSWVDTP